LGIFDTPTKTITADRRLRFSFLDNQYRAGQYGSRELILCVETTHCYAGAFKVLGNACFGGR
jgi:hypothetical protein